MSCDTVTRSELLANFIGMPSRLTSKLRTLIVGPDYAARHYDLTDDTGFIGVYDTAGVTAAWPGLEAGEAVDLGRVSVVIVNALLRYFSEAEANPTAANGAIGSTANRILHNEESTIWAGTDRTGNVPADVIPGDKVYLDADGAGTDGFETTVTAIEAGAGSELTVLVLEDNVPAALAAGNFNINIAEVTSAELPAGDLTLTADDIEVAAGLTLTSSRLTAPTAVEPGLTGAYSRLFVEYRALRQTLVGEPAVVVHHDQLDELFVGWQHPESELGFAVARALAPGEGAVPAVILMAVEGTTIDHWVPVINTAEYLSDWYTVAPLTDDSAILDLCVGMVEARKDTYPSRIVVSHPLVTEINLFTGGEAVTLSNGDQTVTATTGIFAGAQAGDVVTLDTTVAVIDSVVSNMTVNLVNAVTGATEVLAVDHPTSAEEQAMLLGQRAQQYASRAVSVVFPTDPTWRGDVVPAWLYAAAVAGLRGFTAPHQSLRSVEMEAGWAVPQAKFEFLPYLETLAAYGVFVSHSCNGAAVIRYANTTDPSQTETRSEWMVSNIDAVTHFFNDLAAANEGKLKVYRDAMSQLRARMSTIANELKAGTTIPGLGGVFLEAAVGAARQDPVNADSVRIPVVFDIPAGLERLSIAINIELTTI